MASDGLPQFEPGKIYLLRGASGQAITQTIRRNRPDVVTGSGLDKQQQEDGLYIKGAGKKGSGGSLTVSDDSTSVPGVTSIVIPGFYVSDLGGGAVQISILPPLPESGTYVLASVDGALSWIETDTCLGT